MDAQQCEELRPTPDRPERACEATAADAPSSNMEQVAANHLSSILRRTKKRRLAIMERDMEETLAAASVNDEQTSWERAAAPRPVDEVHVSDSQQVSIDTRLTDSETRPAQWRATVTNAAVPTNDISQKTDGQMPSARLDSTLLPAV
jgi:hypothetical protein